MKRRIVLGVVAAVVVGAGGIAGYVIHVRQAGQDVKGSSTIEFVRTQTVPAAPPPPPLGVAWPTYGHDPQRLRFANGIALAPPFRRLWQFPARSLVEFPPAVAYGRLYFANNDGILFAIGAKNGLRAWKYVSNRCQAASPAVADHVVYAVFMNEPPCNRAPSPQLTGEVVALEVGSGNVRWRRTIGPSESSPVVVDGVLFTGDWNGRVWALDAATGKTRWSAQLGGQVKGGVAVSGRRLFVGDYSGHVYALDRRTGKVLWTAAAQARLGNGARFYATPAAAYGRVYIGGTDGKVYSYGAESGQLRWSASTGGYVYSSTAVWRDRIYAGSYDGSFYCFDAATGQVLWRFAANGPISGSPTVIAGRVYFATLRDRTYALDAKTGSELWTFPDGKYSPVVADAERLYLVGQARVYGLAEARRSGG